jgi:hypothetical protein
MFFQRKGRLRKEFDMKLLDQLQDSRNNRIKQKTLVERCLDPSKDIISEAKLAELKYFYFIREAKSRNLSIRN